MQIDPISLREAVAANLPEARGFLAGLIAVPSLSGRETAAMRYVEESFSQLCCVARVALTNALLKDRDYSDPVPGIEYDGRYNLRGVLGGTGGGRNLLLNTHVDTVPPAQGQVDPYTAAVRDNAIFGRGACDAKGQVATIYLAIATLLKLGVPLRGDLIAHLVVEEENGGNGTLAMARHGEKADACVVLEPTGLRILSAIRGAVWFRITLKGKAGHSGQAGVTRSALSMAVRVITILESYHARLLAGSRGLEFFDRFENPMPLTIGRLNAGNWPATAPSEAVMEGVLGLLPNKTAKQVMDEMTAAIRDEGGEDIADNFDIHFTYRHDSSVCPTDHELVCAMQEALATAGAEPVVDAMTASCDAWFYNNQLKIPTVCFGGGSLGVAHSAAEQMPLDELALAAEALVALVIRYCGEKSQ